MANGARTGMRCWEARAGEADGAQTGLRCGEANGARTGLRCWEANGARTGLRCWEANGARTGLRCGEADGARTDAFSRADHPCERSHPCERADRGSAHRRRRRRRPGKSCRTPIRGGLRGHTHVRANACKDSAREGKRVGASKSKKDIPVNDK